MKLLIAALALLLVAATYTEPSPFDRQPLTVCYQTDGAAVRTAYIDGGTTDLDPYPVELEQSVTDDGALVHVDQRIVLRRTGVRVFLPVMVR